ncbi:hypothetical protein EDC04DRAFT_2600033 [Pisolithus marmoratus]|nr:hypothetical protein EDC04DRAFT_2600033 [Pisolithus marmoratus]
MHQHQGHAPACCRGHDQLLDNIWAARKTALTSCLQQSNVVNHFATIHDEEVLKAREIWGPFKSEEEWELVKWLIKNVGHGQADQFLWLNINKTDLLNAVDCLPQSAEWKCNVCDEDGKPETEELELWF